MSGKCERCTHTNKDDLVKQYNGVWLCINCFGIELELEYNRTNEVDPPDAEWEKEQDDEF